MNWKQYTPQEMFAGAIGAAILIFLQVFGIPILLAWLLQLLWNWVGVDVLSLKTITYWQALGLLFLTGILFRRRVDFPKKKKEEELKRRAA